jgi:hypothetical protein
MKRNAYGVAVFGAVVVLGVTGWGCSSSSSGTGTGGAGGKGTAGAGGAGGHINGQGGSDAGSGDARADVAADVASDGPATLPVCSPVPDDGTTCNNDPACVKICGVNIAELGGRAMKLCTCDGTWMCPSTASACVYPSDVNFSCLRLPTPLMPCPTFAADGGVSDAGTGLIRSGVTTCSPPISETCGNVCGSATAGTFSYMDSAGMEVGYCACVNGTYQCASANEWPTF